MKRARRPSKQPPMRIGFLARYLESFDRIPGWFTPAADLLIAAYSQLAADDLAGDVLEIGVHHGLSAIGIVARRGKHGRLVAIDPFPAPDMRFTIDHPGTFRPIAIGFNQALFQREPAPFDLNARFPRAFPQVYSHNASLWGEPFLWGTRVRFFDRPFREFFGSSRSTPRRLAAVDNVGAVGAAA